MSGYSNHRTAVAQGIGSFHVVFAAGASPRTEEYRLRYRAFVEEHLWEPGDPSGLEHDLFDTAACSATLIDEESGEAAACQRLILPERLAVPCVTNVERFYRPRADEPLAPRRLPRTSWAEVSRLTIAPRFRTGGCSRLPIPALTSIGYATMARSYDLSRTARLQAENGRLTQTIGALENGLHAIGLPEAWVASLVANNGWRLLMIVGALPALLTFLIRLFVPESERWLQEHARGSTSHWAARDLLGVLVGACGALFIVYLWAQEHPPAVRH